MTEPVHPFDPEDLLTHRRWLRAIARSLVGDGHSVDDLEQQVWLAAMERPPRRVRSVTGWLRSVLRSKAIDAHRTDSRREERERKVARPEPVAGTAHLVAQAEAQRVVATAVTELDEPYRSTVLLRYYEGLPPREVALRLGVPVETVRTRLKRAHEQLRGRLDGAFGDDRRAWVLALLPLVRSPAPAPAGPATAAAAAGVALVSAKTKIGIAAAVALLALGSLTWMAVGTDTGSGPPTDDPAAAMPPDADADPQPEPVGTGAVRGLVRRRHDGLAAASVTVEAVRGRGSPVTVTTASDGTFELPDLAAGAAWSLTASATGFSTEGPMPVRIEADTETDVGTLWLESATRLVVRVVDHRDRPVAGAEVELFRLTPTGAMAETHSYLRAITTPGLGVHDEGSEQTGASGEAVFDGLAAGGREIAVTHPELVQSGTKWTRIHAGDLRSDVVVRMLPSSTLSGRFVDADGNPVAGLQVRGSGGPPSMSDHAWSVTDAEGRFRLRHLRPGRTTVHAGFERSWNRRFATVDVPFEGELVLAYPRTGTVVGRVTDGKGEPVRGAVVAVEVGDNLGSGSLGAKATTDAEGRYRIDGLPEGGFKRIQVWSDGYRIVEPSRWEGRWVRGTGAARVAVEPLIFAGRTTELDLVVGRAARIHGRVLGPDGPVAGAWVSRHATKSPNGEDWETVVTDAEGRYVFEAVPALRHLIHGTKEGYFQPGLPGDVLSATRKGEIADAFYLDVPPSGDLEHDIRLEAGVPVAGRVLSAQGIPLAGTLVFVESRGYGDLAPSGTRTDAEGRFRIERVRPGEAVDLVASLAGHAMTEPVRIDVQAGVPTPPVEIRLQATAELTGRVVDADGRPVADTAVRMAPRNGTRGLPPVPHSDVITDASGAFRSDLAIASGEIRLGVDCPSGSGKASVRVKAGSPPPVEIVLEPAHSLAGIVRFADGGEPVVGASIHVRGADETVYYQYGQRAAMGAGPERTRAVTDGEGHWEVRGLAAGDLHVVVSAPGIAERVVAAAVPASDALTIEVDRARRLTGRLEQTPGVPAAIVSIRLVPAELEATAEQVTDLGTVSPRFIGLLRRATDPDGGFAFHGLRPGTYTLEAHAPGPSPYEAQVTRFGPFEAGREDLVLTLDRPQTGRILGRVVTAAGHSVPGASVAYLVDGVAFSSQRTVRADAEGRFEIPEAAHGRYRLSIGGATGPGAASITRLFRGVEPGEREQTFLLEPGLVLRGRVVDERGAPVAEVHLSAELPGLRGSERSAISAADGSVEIRDLEPGAYALSIVPGDDVAQHVRIVGGEHRIEAGTQDLELVVSAEPRIRGVAVDREGAPLADFLVHAIHSEGGYELVCRTDEQGRFAFPGLEPGESYWLRPGYGWEHGKASYRQRVSVEAGKLDVRLTFDPKPE